MAPRNKIIIDTDPGVDDILALLLALSATSEELQVLLISVTHGNVEVEACLRNVVALFHILDQEIEWRKSQGLAIGFEGITRSKPVVAIGADEPLHEKLTSADYFHGRDGLAGIHTSHPQFTPAGSWKKLFERPSGDSIINITAEAKADLTEPTESFTPSLKPAHQEILRVLRDNEPNTVSLISIGPLTNFALAAAEDTETFLRAKEVISMGGAIDSFGNVTPVAEFNVYADPLAAARIYALSSQVPSSTMPPLPTQTDSGIPLPPYPAKLPNPLTVRLMSLDITEHHPLTRRQVSTVVNPLATNGSPLAQWFVAFMTPMLDKMERLHIGHEGDGAALALHDPLTVWYVLTQDRQGWQASAKSPEDIRVETTGQWTRGMTVGDKRARKRRGSDGDRPYDHDNWLGNQSGNRIYRMLDSPGIELAGKELLERIFNVKIE